jgi:hypothetical protein
MFVVWALKRFLRMPFCCCYQGVRSVLLQATAEPLVEVGRKYGVEVVLVAVQEYLSAPFTSFSSSPASPAYAWR